MMLLSITSSGQGLFESSLSESSDIPGQEFLTIGGFIRSATYIGETTEKRDLYLQSAYAQASLQLKAKAGSKVSAFTDIRFRYGTEWQETVSEIDLREAYVNLQTGPVDFSLGKLIAPWGKGTVFNPVNKLTPMDPTLRSPESDDMNLGIWALQGGVNLGSYLKLTATWNPLYQPGKLLIDPIPMPEYVYFLEPGTLGREDPGTKRYGKVQSSHHDPVCFSYRFKATGSMLRVSIIKESNAIPGQL